jgi:hypothetical protein
MKQETLPLLSPDKKSELLCYVVADVKVSGVRYVLLTPTKPWLSVVIEDDDGVEDVDAADVTPLVPLFNESLKQHGLSVRIESDEVLLDGELTDAVRELCDTVGVNDEDEDDAHLILADVEHDGATYLLLSPELPAMFAAKVEGGKGHPLTDKELERVEDKLEAALVDKGN